MESAEVEPNDVTSVVRLIESSELGFWKKRLEAKGYYWHVAEAEEVKRLNTEPEELGVLLDSCIEERLLSWAELAHRTLSEDTLCLWTGGNDDDDALMTKISAMDLPRFKCGEDRVVQVGNINVMSLGVSNITPFHTSRELSEDEISLRLEKIRSDTGTSENLVMNVQHVPPFGCETLDLVMNPRNPYEWIHVGSTAVREFIEREQPLADFAGHVHEGKGVVEIGRCSVFNPGSVYQAGILQGYLVNIARSRVIDYAHFTS